MAPSRTTSLSLRKLVAGLARMQAADREAILDDLSGEQQREVRALLKTLEGRDPLHPPPEPTAKPAQQNSQNWALFSDTFAKRLSIIDGSGSGEIGDRMTPAARATLKSCAGQIVDGSPRREPSSLTMRRGWRGLVIGRAAMS